jgi:hypothetical protein
MRRVNFRPPNINQLSRSPIIASIRRNTVVNAVLNGANRQQAGELAGFSPRSAATQASMALNHPESQQSIAAVMTDHGISDERLSDKISQLLDCEFPVHFSWHGKAKDTRYVPAYETQRKTLELALKLRGHLKDKSEVDIKVGIMAVVMDALQAVPDNNDEDNDDST